MTKVVAIVAARMGSQRLPGKHLEDLGGRPMLSHVLERAQAINLVDQVVLATTTSPEDDALLPVATAADVPVFRRQDPDDVLGRYAACAAAYHADVVIRITADCPLFDPALATLALVVHERVADRETVTTIPASLWLDGLDVEIFGASWLATAHHTVPALAMGGQDYREHVTGWLRDFGAVREVAPLDGERDLLDQLPAGSQKWSVDTPADLARVRAILQAGIRHDQLDWRNTLDAALRAAGVTPT